MGFEEDIREYLEEAVTKHKTAKGLSEATGVSQPNISSWRKGVSPHVSAIAPIIDNLGVRLNKDFADYALIPKTTAKAGAGSSLITENEERGLYAFRRQFLTRMGISEQSVLLDVIGNSMQPLLENGDTILVDKTKTELQEGKIFLVGLDEELLVKQIFKRSGGWTLHSKNPDFPDIPISKADNFRVYGKVVWSGRYLG